MEQTWMLINSIQLIAYSVLFEISLPAQVQFFLGKLLNALRLRLSTEDDEFTKISSVDLSRFKN